MMRRTVILVLLIIALLLAAGCAGRQGEPAATPAPTTPATTAPPVTGPGGNVTEADLLALQASIEAMSFDEPGGLSGD